MCTFNLYIIGFPSLYGGAGAELYHRIRLWHGMGVQMHIIPTQMRAETNVLYPEILAMGITVHAPYDWKAYR